MADMAKPRIVHLWPSQFVVGGAPRFIAELANWAAPWADVHVLYRWGTDGFWQPKTHATFHRCDSPEDTLAKIDALQPDLVHHHFPAGRFVIPELEERFPLIGTSHGWDYGCKESLDYAWVHPVSGPQPSTIRLGLDLTQYILKQHHNRKEIVVGIVGRRGPEKYPDTFLARLERGIPEGVRVKCVGDGWKHRKRDEITARLEKIQGVELVGDISQDRMPAVYHQFDALLVPSSTESVSYAALEAMASGLPVVARNVAGLPETLGSSGILCDTDDALLHTLKILRDAPALRSQLGAEGRQRVGLHYALDRMLREYSDAYAQHTHGVVRAPDPSLDCSLVIPVYNTPVKWLKESFDSVLAQEGRFEIVVVDDGSTTSDTVAALHAYAKLPNVRLLTNEQNQGVGASLNRGVLAAASDVIVRHDSDDIMLPGRIQRQVDYLREHSETVLVSGQMHVMDENGNPLKSYHVAYDPALPMWAQKNNVNPILHSSVACRRHAMIKAGLYPPDSQCQDFALWCAMQVKGYRMDVLDEYFFRYRVSNWEAKTKTRIIHDREIRKRFRAMCRN
jgi:alpha-1,6-rhamnosyltransferase